MNGLTGNQAGSQLQRISLGIGQPFYTAGRTGTRHHLRQWLFGRTDQTRGLQRRHHCCSALDRYIGQQQALPGRQAQSAVALLFCQLRDDGERSGIKTPQRNHRPTATRAGSACG